MTATRQRLAPAQRRQQIIDAARVLYSDRAYDDVSTSELAEAAGVARGLINHYFGDKRELFLAVMRETPASSASARSLGTAAPSGRSAMRLRRWSTSRWYFGRSSGTRRSFHPRLWAPPQAPKRERRPATRARAPQRSARASATGSRA